MKYTSSWPIWTNSSQHIPIWHLFVTGLPLVNNNLNVSHQANSTARCPLSWFMDSQVGSQGPLIVFFVSVFETKLFARITYIFLLFSFTIILRPLVASRPPPPKPRLDLQLGKVGNKSSRFTACLVILISLLVHLLWKLYQQSKISGEAGSALCKLIIMDH